MNAQRIVRLKYLKWCHILNFYLRTTSQAARGIENLWWVKVTVPTKTLYILNAEVVLITVWGVANPGLWG